jgi:nitrile hydratase beta subunit
MNSMHDMGGMDGFGPVITEANEPVFHSEWERRMFAIGSALPYAMPYGLDDLRREIERIPPVDYLRWPYYAYWLHAIGRLLEKRRAPHMTKRAAVTAEIVEKLIRRGASTRMSADGIVPLFSVGDKVRARNIHPTGHTRLPRYARGRTGRIERNHGVFRFADSNARGEGPHPHHLYTVAFTAPELWGEDAASHDKVFLDLWGDYLEPVSD